MPADRDDAAGRRRVVPDAARRSLWLAAVWTGVGAAVVCATAAIAAVAVLWIPAAGASGHAISAIRAGLLTFLAALHGGVAVDGTSGQFLPLGLTVIVGLAAWRAGSGLGDAATALDECDPVRLAIAGGAQAASFTVVALVAVPFAELGTSSAPFLGVGIAALALFAVTGGVAFVRASALRVWVADRVPGPVPVIARAGAAAVAVYVAAGAVLVAGSLVVHHGRVEALSREVGGGWSSVPLLLLCVLAVPNAVIAGVGYLTGAGFAVGAGASVSPIDTTHGVLPAFPLLGGLPVGHGATPPVWVLVVVTPFAAGLVVARLVAASDSLLLRLRNAFGAAAAAGAVMLVLAWQGGGGIGGGRLATIGVSPWRVALLICGAVASTSVSALLFGAGWHWLRHREVEPTGGLEAILTRPSVNVAEVTATDEDAGTDQLAG